MRKLQPWSVKTDEGGPVEITRAFFRDASGKECTSLGPFWALFLSSDQEVELSEDQDYVYQSFVIPSKPPIQWAHRALPIMLGLRSKGSRIHWRSVLREHHLPVDAASIKRAAKEAAGQGVFHAGFDVCPPDLPVFLKDV